MPLKTFLTSVQTIVAKTLSSSLVLSLLLIGLEAVLEQDFSCPCKQNQSLCLIRAIFIVPSGFAFAIMFVHLTPCGSCSAGCREIYKEKLRFSEDIAQCLIPPVMWIIILLLDGDYLGCSKAKLEGHYIHNKELNRKWCQPSEWDLTGNKSDLLEYQELIYKSQRDGYICLSVFSFLIILVGCSCGSGHQRGQQDKERGGGPEGESIAFRPNNPSTTAGARADSTTAGAHADSPASGEESS